MIYRFLISTPLLILFLPSCADTSRTQKANRLAERERLMYEEAGQEVRKFNDPATSSIAGIQLNSFSVPAGFKFVDEAGGFKVYESKPYKDFTFARVEMAPAGHGHQPRLMSVKLFKVIEDQTEAYNYSRSLRDQLQSKYRVEPKISGYSYFWNFLTSEEWSKRRVEYRNYSGAMGGYSVSSHLSTVKLTHVPAHELPQNLHAITIEAKSSGYKLANQVIQSKMKARTNL